MPPWPATSNLKRIRIWVEGILTFIAFIEKWTQSLRKEPDNGDPRDLNVNTNYKEAGKRHALRS
jgi:hypothetical protein